MASQIDKLKREFLEYLEIEKGRALRTIENYDHYLTHFFEFAKIKNVNDITDSSVREFRLWLNRQSTSPLTRSRGILQVLFSLNKQVQIPFQNSIYIRGFGAGAVIFHHLVRMQDI